MGTNGCAVDHLNVTIVGGGDGIHHPIPDPCLSPSHEAIVAGSSWPIALRQIAPRRPRPQHPENAIQHATIIDAGHTSRFVGNQWLYHAPLEVGQVVSAHADAESETTINEKVEHWGLGRYAACEQGIFRCYPTLSERISRI